jgi:hypothetical protein
LVEDSVSRRGRRGVAAVLATLPATAMCQNVNISVVGVLSGSPSEVNQII